MYTGEEKFILGGKDLPSSMLNYWQWTLSCIHDSTVRGGFAEFIVKLALDYGGFKYNDEPKSGMELYDLDGPVIPSNGEKSRIEVKATGYFHINPYTGFKKTQSQQFSISKKKTPDETGDFKDDAVSERHNDIYVLVVYNGKDEQDNIFDLSLWDFYVLPTYVINNDPALENRTTITLRAVQKLCEKNSFEELPKAIDNACRTIPTNGKQREL